jgi:hypothetical protein
VIEIICVNGTSLDSMIIMTGKYISEEWFKEERPPIVVMSIRPKALIILRIRGEIKPRDRKRGHLGQEVERKRRNRLLMYVLFAIAYS